MISDAEESETLNLQCSKSEDDRNADLPSRRHLQSPDDREGNYYHHQVRKSIDGSRTNDEYVNINAVARGLGIPNLFPWCAVKDFSEGVCGVKDGVEPEYAVNRPVDLALAVRIGDEYSQVQK